MIHDEIAALNETQGDSEVYENKWINQVEWLRSNPIQVSSTSVATMQPLGKRKNILCPLLKATHHFPLFNLFLGDYFCM